MIDKISILFYHVLIWWRCDARGRELCGGFSGKNIFPYGKEQVMPAVLLIMSRMETAPAPDGRKTGAGISSGHE